MQTENDRDRHESELSTLCARFRQSMHELAHQYPELNLVVDEFEGFSESDTDPLKEMASLLKGSRRVLVRLRHLLNPINVPLRIGADGRILTRTVPDVAVMVTDIRGFTELTSHVKGRWDTDVFDVLSYCYFPHVVEVLERHECRYLNYTGDGLLVLSQNRSDEGGRVLLPALDNAVLCTLEMVAVTNCIAETWKRMGLVQENGVWHETGVGLTFGTVQVGDPFVPDQDPTRKLAEFDNLFRSLVSRAVPYFSPRTDFKRRVIGIHALSPAINRASRLQDVDKSAPDYTCMTTESDYRKLCPTLRRLFERVGNIELKGLGNTEVFGLHRYKSENVPELNKECRAFYASA